MDFEFDPEKSARNEAERGLPFELAAELDWMNATIIQDHRRDYGEERFLAFARLHGRLYVACFSRRGEAFRIISFRKANKREESAHAKTPTDR